MNKSFFCRMCKKIMLWLFVLMCSLQGLLAGDTPRRIITLSSALTETTDALGLGPQIVATDVTSEYPAYAKQLPKVSRNRSFSVEGILMYRPDIVLVPENDIPRNIASQLKKAGVRLVTFRQEFSVKGASQFIAEVAAALQVTEKATSLIRETAIQLQSIRNTIATNKAKEIKVLFIYARGTGVMSVAGKGSNMDAMIQLAGGRNAVQEFADFKPYSTEALIKANPDVVLLFDFGASSLGGKAAILKMPGMSLTNAGRQQRIIEVDGPLMVNFAARLPAAIKDLHDKLYP